MAVVKGPKNNKRRVLWIRKTIRTISNFNKYKKPNFYGNNMKSRHGIQNKFDINKVYNALF